MEKYVVVLEKAENNFSAFCPDVWGCIATGETVEETKRMMQEALQFHIEGLIETGENVPAAKGISQHIADGVFMPGEIADEYYITEVEIPVSQHA
jgi:predicted RNase H-like HicB family nuclease